MPYNYRTVPQSHRNRARDAEPSSRRNGLEPSRQIYRRAYKIRAASNDFPLSDKALLGGLRVLQNQGRPLWDGVSEVRLRESLPKEIEIWRTRCAAADPSISDDGKNWGVFLIAVVDPSEFDDDRDDDGFGD